jgi:hypothetical protein
MRMNRRRTALVGIVAFLLALTTASGTTAASAARPGEGVDAILLDSAFGCFVGDAWADLNNNWSNYGSVPVSITSGGHLCDGTFTLADLEASGADTVILEGTAFGYTLTPDQIQALQTYVEQGHTLLGTDTVFQWKSKNNDNGLSPLFGLAEQSPWNKDRLGRTVKYKLRKKDPDAPVLLRDVADPYISSLYGNGQNPATKKWLDDVLDGARYIAQTPNRGNGITVYDAPAYTAIYISSQAAFMSTPDDLQFLYNALVYPNVG